MTFIGSVLVLMAVVQAGPAQARCAGAASAPALDHVVLVVRDLEAASARLEDRGFRLKAGRLHGNNLLNRHVKFRDGSGIELMTLAGAPGDAMAENYAALLAAGEGGVFAAFASAANADPARAAAAVGLETRESTSGPWRFLSFAPRSPAAAMFFSSGVPAVKDPESLVSHDPDVAGLAEVWIEGGIEAGALLARMGAASCGAARLPGVRAGERWGLGRGRVVVVPAREGTRPRVLGAVLESLAPRGGAIYPHDAFWIRYETRQAAQGALPEPRPQVPFDLAGLAKRARIDGRVTAWCRAEFRSSHAGAFALAVTSTEGGGRYVGLDADGTATELASFEGAADLSCYSRAEAVALDASIQQSETVDGHIAPRFATTVVCGFTDGTTAVCWQYSPGDRAFVQIGRWVT